MHKSPASAQPDIIHPFAHLLDGNILLYPIPQLFVVGFCLLFSVCAFVCYHLRVGLRHDDATNVMLFSVSIGAIFLGGGIGHQMWAVSVGELQFHQLDISKFSVKLGFFFSIVGWIIGIIVTKGAKLFGSVGGSESSTVSLNSAPRLLVTDPYFLTPASLLVGLILLFYFDYLPARDQIWYFVPTCCLATWMVFDGGLCWLDRIRQIDDRERGFFIVSEILSWTILFLAAVSAVLMAISVWLIHSHPLHSGIFNCFAGFFFGLATSINVAPHRKRSSAERLSESGFA